MSTVDTQYKCCVCTKTIQKEGKKIEGSHLHCKYGTLYFCAGCCRGTFMKNINSYKKALQTKEKGQLIEIVFVGIDSFNRPVYKDRNGNHYGSVNDLFGFDATKKEINIFFKSKLSSLCYFGKSFDCEPDGTDVKNLKIVDKL